jgi:hypothetical protein
MPRPYAARLLFCSLLLASPSSAQLVLRGPIADDRFVQPGDVYDGSFVIENTGAAAVEVDVFPDASARLTAARSNAGWVDVGPARLTVPSGEARRVFYAVRVPELIGGGVPLGTYWSHVTVTGGGHSAALQLATHIVGTGVTDLAFREVAVRREEGVPVIETSFENTGDVMVQPAIWVELYTPAGELVDRLTAGSARLYPGDSLAHRLPIEAVDAGIYEALIVVDAGGEHIFGAQYTLDLGR